jgi:hypothetical protein
MSLPRVAPLFEYKFPQTEYVFVQRPDQPRQPMSVKEFNQCFGTSLVHGVFYDTRQADLIQKIQAIAAASSASYVFQNEQLQTYLKNPKNYFSVCYINETCGYALVANEDIPAETVVGTYSGLLVVRRDSEDMVPRSERDYDMGYSDLSPMQLDDEKFYLTLRAKHYSDITRFAIHLPTATELSAMKDQLDPSINVRKVMTANIQYPLATIDGVPIRYYLPTEPIKKGGIAGISYGVGYWINRGKPHLLVREHDRIHVASYDIESQRYEKKTTINIQLDDMKPEPTPMPPSFYSRRVPSVAMPLGVLPSIAKQTPQISSEVRHQESVSLSEAGLARATENAVRSRSTFSYAETSSLTVFQKSQQSKVSAKPARKKEENALPIKPRWCF